MYESFEAMQQAGVQRYHISMEAGEATQSLVWAAQFGECLTPGRSRHNPTAQAKRMKG